MTLTLVGVQHRPSFEDSTCVSGPLNSATGYAAEIRKRSCERVVPAQGDKHRGKLATQLVCEGSDLSLHKLVSEADERSRKACGTRGSQPREVGTLARQRSTRLMEAIEKFDPQ